MVGDPFHGLPEEGGDRDGRRALGTTGLRPNHHTRLMLSLNLLIINAVFLGEDKTS